MSARTNPWPCLPLSFLRAFHLAHLRERAILLDFIPLVSCCRYCIPAAQHNTPSRGAIPGTYMKLGHFRVEIHQNVSPMLPLLYRSSGAEWGGACAHL
jgi:hypothetical protein